MLVLQNISYLHPNNDLLFDGIHLAVNRQEKVALIGNNGAGKSTLLKLIAHELEPSEGQLKTEAPPYYVPQIFGQYNHLTIAEALQVDEKLKALHEILNGNTADSHFEKLADDWTLEDRCMEALSHWQLPHLDLRQKMETLSGGQKTKVLLAGISIHQPELVLLDEPSNHLDMSGRKLLYEFIESTNCTLVVVSHDRTLLNLLDATYELNARGIMVYGGNYDFYAKQKQIERDALYQDIHGKEKALRKAKEKERETLERKEKSDARGKKKQEKAGVARIMMNTMKNNAEKSASKAKSIHSEKIGGIAEQLHELRSQQFDIGQMKFGLNNSALHIGKVLLTAENINFSYQAQWLWSENLSIQITSGERIALKGANGSGKTTLIKLILGWLAPQQGTIRIVRNHSVYIDQDYSLIDNTLSVYDQAQQSNTSALLEHEIKIRLNRFLFTREDWDKPCMALSGGERMRLMLCCMTINSQSPDLIILDEPTNNLDIQNIEILTAAINVYQGTLIVVSHDESFLTQINVERTIHL